MLSTAHNPGRREAFQAALSDRLKDMERAFTMVRDGQRTINGPREIDAIVTAVTEMVADARDLEAAVPSPQDRVNHEAIEAANLLYSVRDDLTRMHIDITTVQRVLIDRHRKPTVDPDGHLVRKLDDLQERLGAVRELIRQASAE